MRRTRRKCCLELVCRPIPTSPTRIPSAYSGPIRPLIGISESVAHEAWDEDFQYEVNKVLQRDVAPAMLEIEGACNANKYLRTLTEGITGNAAVLSGASALAVLVSNMSSLSEAASVAIGAATGATMAASGAYKEWRDKRQEVESNRFFFYYKAGKLLEH